MAQKRQPVIQIDDLQPDWSAKAFNATWQDRGLIAYAHLTPLQDQPARGYMLECGYNTVSGREPTNRQIDTGTTLTSEVREFMLAQMALAGWREIAEDEKRRPIWQHSSRIAATAPALQVEQDQGGADLQKPRKTLLVPARENVKSYQRTITANDVTFTCARCHLEVTKSVFPGATPLYCDDCAKEVEREKTRARVARYRAAKRGGQVQAS